MSVSLLYDNKIVSFGGTLSTDSPNAGYPVNNLKDYNSASVARTADDSSIHYFIHDFGSATNVNATALANVNFSSTSVVKIQASTTSNFAVLNVDETITTSGLAPTGQFNLFWKLSQAYTFRYWRLEIDDVGGSGDGFYEVGEWFLGFHVTLASGQQFEMPWTRVSPDPNVLHQTEWLSQYAYIRDVQDVVTMNLDWRGVTAQTRGQLRTMKLTVKNSGFPFFICPDDTQTAKESFFVRMTGDFEDIRETVNRFSIRMNLQEQARGLTLPSVA